MLTSIIICNEDDVNHYISLFYITDDFKPTLTGKATQQHCTTKNGTVKMEVIKDEVKSAAKSSKFQNS